MSASLFAPVVRGIALTACVLCSASALADTVNATLSANYFQVLSGTGGPDFGGSGTPNLTLGSTLGPDGMPVVNSGNPGVAEYNSNYELTWWSPSMNSAVLATGTGTISLPYSSNMYAPNSTGGSDAASFETAYFIGDFSLTSASAVSFQLGSDDDSFIYVDGVLIGQNPGIHGVTDVNFSSGVLGLGQHSVEVFYVDREETGAYLSLNLNSTDVVITPPAPASPASGVPEPSSMALVGLALAGLAAARRKAR